MPLASRLISTPHQARSQEQVARSSLMKTGIIGLPQVGKTSLFRILTKAHLSEQAYSNPREAHVGLAKFPAHRLDRLPPLHNPHHPNPPSLPYSATAPLPPIS